MHVVSAPALNVPIPQACGDWSAAGHSLPGGHGPAEIKYVKSDTIGSTLFCKFQIFLKMRVCKFTAI